ncbi:carnosine synthase 1-like [Liolophura sinensis]|uniref:carnosine synthase 1-like n=1 Tax=Liolophura sinensis TaxID=3198878 RepID=UPI00315994BA
MSLTVGMNGDWEQFSDDPAVRHRYEELQQVLHSIGYPSIDDQSGSPCKGFSEKDVTIAWLSSNLEGLSLLLESCQHCPGDLFLVLSSDWLIKKPLFSNKVNMTQPGAFVQSALYVKKGICCYKGGSSYLKVFDPPRKVTYFFNSTSDASLIQLFNDVDCPQSVPPGTSRLLSDIILMRILLAQSGIKVPKTLAFPYKPRQIYDKNISGITVVPITSDGYQVADVLRPAITNFQESPDISDAEWVTVKIFRVRDNDDKATLGTRLRKTGDILGAVCDLLPHASKGDIILIQCDGMNTNRFTKPNQNENKLNELCSHEKRDVGVHIQTTVCRNPEDEPVHTSTLCFISGDMLQGRINEAPVQSLEDTLKDLEINSEPKQQFLRNELKRISEEIMKIIMELDGRIDDDRSTNAQTDLIVVDFMVTSEKGDLLPVPVNVGCQRNQLYDVINPDEAGEAVRPLLATMLTRSLKYILAEKRILVLGAGLVGKTFVWNTARDCGIKVHLIDEDPNTYAADLVEEFIHYDMSDHTRDKEHCEIIVQMLQTSERPALDGCVTLWDDCVPLTAMICEAMSFVGSPIDAAVRANTKSKTQEFLFSKCPNTMLGRLQKSYASSSYQIRSRDQIKLASRVVKFPAVMKPEYGAGSIGVKLLDNIGSCYAFYDQAQWYMKTENDFPGVCHGTSMLLMDYLVGTEHGVDVVIYDKKLVTAFVHDKGPTRLPTFTKVSSCFPTTLSPSKANQLVYAAFHCCIGIGLDNGTFNVDLKMTATGPKLIEINARLGGYDLRDNIKKCFKVDTLLLCFAISCGIRPRLVKSRPSCYIMTLCLTASDHGHALTPDTLELLRKLKDQGLMDFSQFQATLSPSAMNDPFCSIGATASDCHTAKVKLLELGKWLGLDDKNFPITYCLSKFT